MKDVRDGGNVDESRFLSYNQRRCLGRWLRALAALCLALTMAGGFTIVAGGIASGASAHALAPNQSCYVLSAKAADQWFCLTADAGVSQVQLTWDPSTPVNSVTVYQGDAEGNGQPAKICNVTDSSAVVPELTTGTTYYFWLVVGGTIMSNIVSATPSDQLTVPGTPAGLAATAGDHKATLRWKAPTSGGAPISGYDVSYATSADFTGATVVHGGKRTGLVVPKLVNGTTYYFKVSAVNLRGNGQAACEVSAVPVGRPVAPTGLATAAGNGQVTLTWTAPASNGGSDVTGYNVYYATSAGFKGATKIPWGTDTAVTVLKLVNGTLYYFWVTAVNKVGEGPPSKAATATPVGAPVAPTGLAATAGDGQVTLTWVKPASDGGSPVTGYNVSYATSADFTGASVVHAGTGTGLVVPKLVNGTTYYFRLTAVNRLGESGPSNVVNAVPVGAPVAPTGLAATAGDGQVTLSWTAPGSGGAPIGGYNVYQGTSPGGEAATPVNHGSLVTATSFKVTGLVNGTTYYFRVAAVNRVGEGQRSNEVKTVPVGVPGAPAGLTVSPGNARATLSWIAPGSDGGSPVTGYNIYVATSADFKGATKVPRGTGTAVTVTGLVDGTTYYFRVTAVNRVGEGPASAAAKAVPATVPGAPVGLTATPGKSKVILAWATPQSGGSPITGYIIYKGTSPGGETGPAVNASLVTSTSYTVTGLVNGTQDYFEVFAVNAVGQGPPSEASATLPPIVPPTSPTSPASTITSPTPPAFGGPTGLTATAGDTKVRLSWIAPASDGGSPVTGYKIYVATTPDAQQSTRIVTAKSADATVTHLVNGTTYYFMVTAVNTAGHESPFSTEVSAEPAKLGTQVKVSPDSPTIPPQLIALITAAAAMVTAAGFTLIMRGRSHVGSRKRTHSEHSHEAEVGSDVRAVADVGRPDAVSVRDTGQEPTHTIRLEPHPGVSTTTIKEGRP